MFEQMLFKAIESALSDFLEEYSRKQDRIWKVLAAHSAAFNRIEAKLNSLEEKIMTTLQDVFTAIETTGTSIITTVNTETAEIIAAIEAAKGDPSADYDAIIAKVGALGSTVGNAVSAMVPSLPTPVEPTPDPEPVPVPDPIEPPAPLPDVEVPVVIEPTPADVGVDGGMAVDFE